MVSSTSRRLVTGSTSQTARGVTPLAMERERRALRLGVVLDDPTRRSRLAYAIRSARDRRGLTPPQLADRLHVARGTVNKWESGEQVPNLLMLGPLCDALGVDANLFAVLPPIPAWEGESYLMDDPADRSLQAAVDSGTPPEQGDGDGSDDPARRAPAQK